MGWKDTHWDTDFSDWMRVFPERDHFRTSTGAGNCVAAGSVNR